ncbi:hypothetical protein MPER_06870 [Moniliophthora perniciosa FA553]|nr:hypothetical protein MPER_06870 [Moniliophthora perniciosa FA553]
MATNITQSWFFPLRTFGVTLILMLIPGVRAYRAGGKSQILKTVYKDGVIYYVLIFLSSVLNVFAVLMLPVESLGPVRNLVLYRVSF